MERRCRRVRVLATAMTEDNAVSRPVYCTLRQRRYTIHINPYIIYFQSAYPLSACLEYLRPCALILLKTWRYISRLLTYLLTESVEGVEGQIGLSRICRMAPEGSENYEREAMKEAASYWSHN